MAWVIPRGGAEGGGWEAQQSPATVRFPVQGSELGGGVIAGWKWEGTGGRRAGGGG